MNATEIKKELYKQRPIAMFEELYEKGKVYNAFLEIGSDALMVVFKIPFNDGANNIENKIEAQLLIRWLCVD